MSISGIVIGSITLANSINCLDTGSVPFGEGSTCDRDLHYAAFSFLLTHSAFLLGSYMGFLKQICSDPKFRAKISDCEVPYRKEDPETENLLN